MALHDGESAPDARVVARLIASQLPTLAHERITRLESLGTVHHVFRIGAGHVARLPRLASGSEDLAREAAVLHRVSGMLPLAVPRVVLVGEPDDAFPYRWAVQEWLAGEPVRPSRDPAIDEPRAEALAAGIAALHRVDTAGLPKAGRSPLAQLDSPTRDSIEATTELDRAALHAAWDTALEAPAWDGVAAAIHADLLPPNLLESAGRLTAIIDWGAAGAGDPAHDLVGAWATLRHAGRLRVRRLLAPDDGIWARARGIALHQALLAIPYYRRTHPRFAALNVATAREVLADRGTVETT